MNGVSTWSDRMWSEHFDVVLVCEQWQFRHTVSYWIGIWYTVGGFFFCIACAADMYKPHLNTVDYYTLVIVTYFLGGLANLLGGYWGYHQVVSEPSRRFKRSTKFGCCRFNRSLHFWASFVFLCANVLTLIPKFFKLIRGKPFEPGTAASIIIDYAIYVVVVTLLTVGGGIQMYLNKVTSLCLSLSLSLKFTFFDDRSNHFEVEMSRMFTAIFFFEIAFFGKTLKILGHAH